MAQVDHADAYEQRPTQREGERAAAGTLRNPSGGEPFSLLPKKQLFDSMPAVFHYSFFL